MLSCMIAPQLESGELELVLDETAPPAAPVHVVHKEPGNASARIRAIVDFLVEQLRREPSLNYRS